MAERLKKPPPTSSIANALNLEAVRAATGPAPSPARGGPAPIAAALEHPAQEQVAAQRPSVVSFPQPQPALPQRHQQPETRPYPSREPTGEPPTVVRQFQITASTDATLQRIIAAYSQATGLKLTNSEFLRAVLHALGPTVALHAREASAIGPLKRTKNEPWLFHERDGRERAIARAFVLAMRAAPVME